MTALDRSRFAALVPSSMLTDVSVMVVGCGCLGSYTALALAKLGVPRFTLIDPDDVGPENIATQLYSCADIGQSKVGALRSILVPVTDEGDVRQGCEDGAPDIDCVYATIESASRIGDSDAATHNSHTFTIASLDNIEARQAVWSLVTRYDLDDANAATPRWLIDPRMSLGLVEINVVPLHQPLSLAYRTYAARLLDSAQRYIPDPCGARSIAGAGMYVAAIIQAIVVQLLNGARYPYILHSDLFDFTNGPAIRATYAPTIDLA